MLAADPQVVVQHYRMVIADKLKQSVELLENDHECLAIKIL